MDANGYARGGNGVAEEHESRDGDEENSESENGSSGERPHTEKLVIRRLKANDRTLVGVWVHSDVELQQVCAAVQENSNIRHFRIFRTVLDLNAATTISTAIAKMPHLEDFWIDECNCGDLEATAMLASALGKKRSMTTLKWVFSNVGDRGAQAISSVFSGNTGLRSLFLTGNNIGNDGAVAIASLIERNNSLATVRLNGNNIGAEGARSLAQMIVRNQSLGILYFRGNGHQAVADTVHQSFKEALYNDESIETIISCSNHTLKYMDSLDDDLNLLLDLNRHGPEKARRTKTIRFLNAKPRSLLSISLDESVVPVLLNKIGRDCQLNTMFELVRSKPALFKNLRALPYRQCRGPSSRLS